MQRFLKLFPHAGITVDVEFFGAFLLYLQLLYTS